MSLDDFWILLLSGQRPESWSDITVSLVRALAWPLTVILLALLFRRQFEGLFRRVRAFKHGAWEVAFDEQVTEGKEAASIAGLSAALVPPDLDLIELAASHPKFAVLEAFQRVEAAAAAIGRRVGGPTTFNPKWEIWAAKKGLLPKDMVPALQAFRRARNSAAHAGGEEISSSSAYEFIDLADRIERQLGFVIATLNQEDVLESRAPDLGKD
jgi:hypothetical protein